MTDVLSLHKTRRQYDQSREGQSLSEQLRHHVVSWNPKSRSSFRGRTVDTSISVDHQEMGGKAASIGLRWFEP